VASQGGSEEALADLRAAVAAPSPRPEALFNLGRVLFGLRRYAEALPALERAVALRTNFAEAWLYLGRALQALGRESEAPAAFARAQAIEPAVSVPR
jgi:tetratricopeptide (TPR) repeat protein